MDIYKIGVEIAMIGGIEAALLGLGKKFMGLHGDAEKVNKELSKTSGIIKGFGQIALGGALLAELNNLVKHGNELVRIQRNMAEAGASPAEVAQATAESWKSTSHWMNVSAVQSLELANNFRGIFGGQAEANSFIDQASGLMSFMKATNHDSAGENILKQVEAAIKSGEISANITPADMSKHLTSLAAMGIAFGDGVKVSDYLTAQRTASVSYRGWDEEMRYGVFPALVQELGQRAGTQAMTSFQRVGAGTMWRGYAIQQGIDLGMIDPNQVNYSTTGPKSLKSQHAIRDQGLAVSNPFEWAIKDLKPAIEKLAASQLDIQRKKGNGTDTFLAEEMGIMGRLFPDRNANAFFTEMITQSPKWVKDVAVMGDARKSIADKGGFAGYVQGSYDYQSQALGTQWHNMLVALGSPLVGDATKGMASINSAMNKLVTTFASHPDAVRGVGEVTAAISALLGVTGLYKVGKGVGSLLTGGGLTGSAAALDGSAAALTRAAVALGGEGVVGPAGAKGGMLMGLLGRVVPALIGSWAGGEVGKYLYPQTDEQRKKFNDFVHQSPGQFLGGLLGSGTYSGPHARSRATHDLAYFNKNGLPAPQVHFAPNMTAHVTLNGRQIAAEISKLVMDNIGKLIPHPTSAPMASSSAFGPNFDGGAVPAL